MTQEKTPAQIENEAKRAADEALLGYVRDNDGAIEGDDLLPVLTEALDGPPNYVRNALGRCSVGGELVYAETRGAAPEETRIVAVRLTQ